MARADKIIEWNEQAIPTATKKALQYCSAQSWFRPSSWYLAGGTALTLYFGHRRSLDLDFFTTKTTFQPRRLVSHFPSTVWSTDILQDDTVYGRLHGAKVSFIAYPHFVPQYPHNRYGYIHILDSRDIATMKVIAISQRGTKRDFIDLYWYCRNQELLIDILHRLAKSYPSVGHDYHHILKSMIYFADADADPTPQLYFSARWPVIKKFFQQEVPTLTKKLLLLNG